MQELKNKRRLGKTKPVEKYREPKIIKYIVITYDRGDSLFSLGLSSTHALYFSSITQVQTFLKEKGNEYSHIRVFEVNAEVKLKSRVEFDI